MKITVFTATLLFLTISFSIAQSKSITTNEHNYGTINVLSPIATISPRWRIGYIKTLTPK